VRWTVSVGGDGGLYAVLKVEEAAAGEDDLHRSAQRYHRRVS
jgi:hypothetical protein